MAHTHKLVDGVRIDLTAEEIAELNARDQIENKKIADAKAIYDANQYQRDRVYPSIGDQLDMLWHSIDQNPKLKSEYFEFYEAIKAVKVKHPKNG